jgi:threonine synthase
MSNLRSLDYEGLMAAPGYTLADAQKIQSSTGVGDTPLIELRNITSLVRLTSAKGKGARIFIKDERSNPSGSFKDRRAAISIYHAARMGYKGVVAASSKLWCSVASQAVKYGLNPLSSGGLR